MILFSLESLADDSHRKHFITNPTENCGFCHDLMSMEPIKHVQCLCGGWPTKWKPDYRAYYHACDKDSLVEIVWDVMTCLETKFPIEIWTCRCESVREKTQAWIEDNLNRIHMPLKMRPIGNTEPAHMLKEKWLDEYMAYPNLEKGMAEGTILKRNNLPDFVFDSDEQSIQMFRRRGIFCFDCRQG